MRPRRVFAASLPVSTVARVTSIRTKRIVSVTRTAQDDTVNEQFHRIRVTHGLVMLTVHVSQQSTPSNAYVHQNELVDCANDSLAVIHVLPRRAWTMLTALLLATMTSTAIVVTTERDVSANRKWSTILANLELATTVARVWLRTTALFACVHQTQLDINANLIEPSISVRVLHAWNGGTCRMVQSSSYRVSLSRKHIWTLLWAGIVSSGSMSRSTLRQWWNLYIWQWHIPMLLLSRKDWTSVWDWCSGDKCLQSFTLFERWSLFSKWHWLHLYLPEWLQWY